MEKIIEVKNLKKSYGEVQAVKGIDFYVEKGQLFAFLGPNGAGKSTTIDILCTLLQKDEGSVTIGGIEGDDDAVRRKIGVVFQDNLLDKRLTVRENLTVRASFYGIKGEKLKEAVARVMKFTDIGDFIDRQYGSLSGGQRRRADIARALIHQPEILFLDEPTTGLDPKTRMNVWETVRELQKSSGTTVFLTTHYMEEAAEADYVAVIDKGVITAKGTPAELREKYSSDHLVLTPKNMEALETALKKQMIDFQRKNGTVRITLKKTVDALPILKLIEDNITIFEVKSGSLDEAFVNITGEKSLEAEVTV